ncbi:MAG: hypothetical protein RMJ36_01795 [Candidatus Calescibacterium sp.]|nr:hypothetical protein [Candidatus Calescibacterium sp.]MDW8132371.1 hypothetical protein [Candidatus Calescibacterium sp.]
MLKKPVLQFSIPCLELETEDKPPIFSYVFYELPYPNSPVSFYIANGWSNGQGSFEQEIVIKKPSGQKLVSTGKQDFELKQRNVPQLMVNYFKDIQFDEFGDYTVEIYLNDEPVMEYVLTVRQLSAEEIAKFLSAVQQQESKSANKPEIKSEKVDTQKPKTASSEDEGFIISG